MWRASARRAEDLSLAWAPGKPGTGPFAALQSLRPVEVDVRVEAPDGAAVARTLVRRLVADGVRLRRWKEGGLAATLALPAGDVASACLLDATAGDEAAAVAALATPLLASRGILVLAIRSGDVAAAVERLAAVPAAHGVPHQTHAVDASGLPPGVPVRDDTREKAAVRARAWDTLLAGLGGRPRGAD